MFDHVLVPESTHASTRMLTTAFQAAMTAPSPENAIETYIETLGKTFNAKRAYVYELLPDTTEFVCTTEWCAPGIDPMSDVTHGLTMDMAARWFGDGEPRSLLAIREIAHIAKVSPEYASLFEPRSMQSQVLGKLMRGNRPMGTLGFDDPDPSMFDRICELMYPICAFATSTINTRNLLGRMSTVGMVDKLTGAGTRMGFYQTAEHLPQDAPAGIAYLDIVGLQGVNDVRGYHVGDELLVAIRQILITEFHDNQVFRMAGDVLLQTYAVIISEAIAVRRGVVGYLGGDNFVCVFPVHEGTDEDYVAQIIEDELDGVAVAEGFSPSVGVVITSHPEVGISILYDRALVALQEVKGNYSDHIAFYDERRFERERENQLLLIEAREGLAKDEFTFFLQPKVNIASNRIVSAEALVRWIHDGEVVPPYKFVTLMEDSGHIFALDRRVWKLVCSWLRSLIDRGIEPVPVSVNVSRVDFYFTDLAEHFCSLVERYDISPKLLVIEVTESAYSKDVDLIDEVLRRMQDKGFSVHMDDFGSGYSSLNMLRSVTVDALKMDKGFIDHAEVHTCSDAIIENVIKMAHMLDLPVISEGVETVEQRNLLRELGCDYVQGYYYYKPMPIDAFEGLLRDESVVEPGHFDELTLELDA